MKSFADSCLGMAAAALLLALPAHAATAKKPIRPVSRVAAPVIEPQPDSAALIAGARDAQNRGQSELALRLAQSAIVADPAHPSAYVALADVYVAQGQPEAARSYYKEALSIDPSDDAAQKAMAALDHGAPGQQAAKVDDKGMKTGTP